MKWDIKIKRVQNGYIMSYDNGDGVQEQVYKIKNEQDETNKDHIIDLFYDILEVMGEWGSKHDKRRIKIGYIKGDEYEKKLAQEGVEFEVFDW